MKRKDILQRLEERLARGEISEKTYLDIKARYDAEPEETEAPAAGRDLQTSIHDAVDQIQSESMRAVRESLKAVHDATGSVDFAGMGVRVGGDVIRITGAGVVSGNPVKTVEFRAAGAGQVRGPLECETVRVSGTCDFDGDVACVDFRSSGASRVGGSIRAQELDVSGTLEVAKDIDAMGVSSSGALRIGGSLRGQDFHSSGHVHIQGELRAQDVDIELGEVSQIGSIQGQDIDVHVASGFLRSRGDLSANRIVGQDVSLVRTTANYVEGNDVRIGPHCHIGTVVAQDLVVHESSEVKERRTPPA